MNKRYRMLVVALLLCAIGVVLVMKHGKPGPEAESPLVVVGTNETTVSGEEIPKIEALPRLVDLGADKCTPCKMMAPILERLKNEYAGIFEVEFIDVWENIKAGEQYGIRMIPTQIFYDAAGKELFRHEGFFGREEILAKWNEYGVAAAAEPGE